MANDPKSVRFQLMMSEDETASIDAWAAENRMPSKAEAVRQLCEIGLEAYSKADRLEQERLRLLHIKRRGIRQIEGLKTRVRDSQDDVERLRLMRRGLDTLAELFEELIDCSEELAVMTIRAVAPAVARRIQSDSAGALVSGGWLPEDAAAENESEMRKRLQAMQVLAARQNPKKDDEN